MNKAFTREADDADDDAPEGAPVLPSGTKNYMTPGGFAALKGELDLLVGKERPELVATIAWAAGNGDRSENGDYIYGKKRLREVDRRIRFLIRRLDNAEVVDPAQRAGAAGDDRVFFGATVDIVGANGEQRTVSIVGVDEIDTARGYISWVSPMARALIKAREGDTVTLQTPAGAEELEIAAVRYVPLATGRWTDGRRGWRVARAPPNWNLTCRAMDTDLALLEQKLATLIAHTRALRAANESLRRELAAAVERNREMTIRAQQAGARLDALIARMPSE